MKLTYWVCKNLNDSDCYNVREKTRKAALKTRDAWGAEGYSEPHKVEVNYHDGFDLLAMCLSEGRVYEGE